MSSSLALDAREALTELVNVAVGRALVPLNELLGRFVHMQAPVLATGDSDDVRAWCEKLGIPSDQTVHVVNQPFCGEIEGDGLVLLSTGGQKIATLLEGGEAFVQDEDAALEVASVFLGACIGQLLELLQADSQLQRPRLTHASTPIADIEWEDPSMTMLVVRCDFSIERTRISGYLVVRVPPSSLEAMQNALARLLGAA